MSAAVDGHAMAFYALARDPARHPVHRELTEAERRELAERNHEIYLRWVRKNLGVRQP